jgi:hypothetical protein
MRRGVVAAFCGLAIPAAAAACSSVLGFKDLYLTSTDATTDVSPDAVRPPMDAATDAGRESGPSPSVCTPGDNSVPPNPMRNEPSPDGAPPKLVLALNTANFAPTALADASPPGLDLDCVWTCFDDSGPSSCVPPNPAQLPCDEPGGRDLRANTLFPILGAFDTNLSPAELNGDVQSGDFGVLIRIVGYNGGAYQSPVLVELFPSSGTLRDGVGTPTTPRLDGTDLWETVTQAVADSDPSLPGLFYDQNAYVTNGVLVFNIANFPLLLLPDVGTNKNPAFFNLQGIVGSVTLTQDDGGLWHGVNGNVAGRWPVSEALKGVSTLTDRANGASLCGCDCLYVYYKDYVCPNLDIASVQADDNKQLPCDALSFSIGFTAVQAQLDSIYDPPVEAGDCPDAWAPTCDPDASPVCNCSP